MSRSNSAKATVVVPAVQPAPLHPAWVSDVLTDVAPILTLLEVAKLLRMSERNVRRLVSIGRIHSIKVSSGPGASRVLFARGEIARLLEEMAGQA